MRGACAPIVYWIRAFAVMAALNISAFVRSFRKNGALMFLGEVGDAMEVPTPRFESPKFKKFQSFLLPAASLGVFDAVGLSSLFFLHPKVENYFLSWQNPLASESGFGSVTAFKNPQHAAGDPTGGFLGLSGAVLKAGCGRSSEFSSDLCRELSAFRCRRVI